MAISLYKQILMMTRRMPVSLAPPASDGAVAAFRRHCPRAPDVLYELWAISDGMELNAPGTVLYSAGEALKEPVLGGCVPLGRMSFGDPLYLDARGQVLQIDRRNGALFQTWPTLVDFLEEERKTAEGRGRAPWAE
ncbi:SMI1/KNR4 family protein [Pseudoflavonifractor sp. CLA-AP-H29]|uniref:SMI1/KNR4 family protein n=1 Tax=Pseudoflavonifractor intestinihominis TaxID=3133171 RepID=A0ABV1E709_9FIRM